MLDCHPRSRFFSNPTLQWNASTLGQDNRKIRVDVSHCRTSSLPHQKRDRSSERKLVHVLVLQYYASQLIETVMSTLHTGESEGRGGEASDRDVFPLTELPDELLEGVLSHLPGQDLVTSCCYVCRKWNELIQGQGLWKEKCLRENYVIPSCHGSHFSIDFRRIYFLNPYGKNLLKNPDATNGFANWRILQNGGDQFTCEKEAVGMNPIFQYAPVEGHVPCWVTSYTDCKKTQLVDLIQSGCSADVLDELQPAIEISEWYGGRFDCGIQYNITVRLLSEDARTVLDEFKFEDTKPAGRDWFHVSHMFQKYGQGLRYIQYTHGGKDTQFWAGHYGVKITLSSIMFNFSENSPREPNRT